MRHLVGDGYDRSRVVGQRRRGEQDQMDAVLQAPDYFVSGLFAGKLTEILFDVLDFERADFEIVLSNEIFHGGNPHFTRMPTRGH